ncbi:MAG: hypothetical protein J5J04_17905 [Anaerolineae bacterium]|nr:hypothetical protein [Anaerolineae bacterium]
MAPVGTAYGFTGELTDGNGLVYLRARYLAPGLGTFASRDPWRGTSSALRTWNGYAWVELSVRPYVHATTEAKTPFTQESGPIHEPTPNPLTEYPATLYVVTRPLSCVYGFCVRFRCLPDGRQAADLGINPPDSLHPSPGHLQHLI